MNRRNRRAMIWANTRKRLEEWEDSSDFDEYGNKILKSPLLSPRPKLTQTSVQEITSLPTINSPVTTGRASKHKTRIETQQLASESS
jgi:hypothetical protein